MDFLTAGALGLIQGATEFLPVSSTGHLVLARSAFSLSDSNGLAFDALLHIATACAAIVYFRKDIVALAHTALRYVGMLPVSGRDVSLLFALLFGTIPAVIAGLLLEELLESALRAPLVVAGALVGGSVLLGVAEYICGRRKTSAKKLTVYKGIGIGIFQVFALIPGVSRSGATISGGMLLGLSREAATRFAFLLAIPVILGAGLKKGMELVRAGEAVSWAPVFLAAAVAFLVGLVAIHFMVTYLRTRTLWPFIWYRLALAGVVVLFVFAG